MDVMYEIPSDDNISECVVTEEAVSGNAQPLIVYKDEVKRLKPAK